MRPSVVHRLTWAVLLREARRLPQLVQRRCLMIVVMSLRRPLAGPQRSLLRMTRNTTRSLSEAVEAETAPVLIRPRRLPAVIRLNPSTARLPTAHLPSTARWPTARLIILPTIPRCHQCRLARCVMRLPDTLVM